MAGLQDISPEQLKDIFQEHEKWVESDGKEGERADLTKANFQRANLHGANLQEAYLRHPQGVYHQGPESNRSMSLSNVYEVEVPPEGFLAWAINTMDAVSVRSDEEWNVLEAK